MWSRVMVDRALDERTRDCSRSVDSLGMRILLALVLHQTRY